MAQDRLHGRFRTRIPQLHRIVNVVTAVMRDVALARLELLVLTAVMRNVRPRAASYGCDQISSSGNCPVTT
jgi:hypothetical protein